MRKFKLLILALFVLSVSSAAYAAETKYMAFRSTFDANHDAPSFTIDIPDIFDSFQLTPDGTLGFSFKDGEYVFIICSAVELKKGEYFREINADNFRLQNDTKTILEELENRMLGELVPGSQKSGGNFYTYRETTEGPREDVEYVRVEYGIRDSKTKAVYYYIMHYPKAEENRFNEIIARVSSSFKFEEEEY